MSLLKAAQILRDLSTSLDKEKIAVDSEMLSKHFVKASEKLAIVIHHAERDLALASAEYNSPLQYTAAANEPSESDLQLEYASLQKKIYAAVGDLKTQHNACDTEINTEKFSKQAIALQMDAVEKARINAIEMKYFQSYKKLVALKDQAVPLSGVDAELTNLIVLVRDLHTKNEVSTEELTLAMDATYARLLKGPKDAFDKVVSDINAKNSVPLKLLGAALVALGLALAVSAIFFAPAVITAATVGLGTSIAYATGLGAASAGLVFAGTSCFFHKTSRMDLADAMAPLADEQIDTAPTAAPAA